MGAADDADVMFEVEETAKHPPGHEVAHNPCTAVFMPPRRLSLEDDDDIVMLSVQDLAQQSEAAAAAAAMLPQELHSPQLVSPEAALPASDAALVDAVARFSLESAGAAFGEDDYDSVLLSASVEWAPHGSASSLPDVELDAGGSVHAGGSQFEQSAATEAAPNRAQRSTSTSTTNTRSLPRQSTAPPRSPPGLTEARNSTRSSTAGEVRSSTVSLCRESSVSCVPRPLSARSTSLGALAQQRLSTSERTALTPPTPPSAAAREGSSLRAEEDSTATAGGDGGQGCRSSAGVPDTTTPVRRAMSTPPSRAATVSPKKARLRAGGAPMVGGGGSHSSSPQSAHLPPEVAALHVFLDRTGGPCGRWDSRDHAVFRRLASSTHAASLASGGDPDAIAASARKRLIDAVLAALPGLYTRTEVEAHAAWDTQHEALLAAKRNALAKWRADKEAAAHAAAAEAAAREAQQRRADAQRLAAERAGRAAELEAWRVAQAQRALREERIALESAAEAVAAAKERKAKEAAELRARMAVVQAVKEQARLVKEAEMAAAAEQEHLRRKEASANAIAVRAQAEARVQAAEEARRVAQSQKAAAARAREARLAKAAAAASAAIESRVTDDPRRLLAPTAAQRAREQAVADMMPSAGLGLESLTHRAVPNWRKGL